MKIAFAYNKDGDFNCNTIGYRFKENFIGEFLVVDIPDEIYNSKQEEYYILKSGEIENEIFHYYSERKDWNIDCWVIHPADKMEAKEVEWESYHYNNNPRK